MLRTLPRPPGEEEERRSVEKTLKRRRGRPKSGFIMVAFWASN